MLSLLKIKKSDSKVNTKQHLIQTFEIFTKVTHNSQDNAFSAAPGKFSYNQLASFLLTSPFEIKVQMTEKLKYLLWVKSVKHVMPWRQIKVIVMQEVGF